MNLTEFKQTMKVGFGRSKLWVKKNSPEILTGTGIILSVVSIALAIVETRRLDSAIVPDQKKIKKLKEEIKAPVPVKEGEQPIDYKKELAKTRLHLAFNVCKLYAPSFISFVLSTACILSSHKIMKGRNLALAAAYATLDNGYRAYRARVAERFGKEVENEIYRGIHKDKVVIVDEKGNELEKNLPVEHINPAKDWAVWFDESNPNWSPNGILNLEWLEMQERYFNQKLKSQGYLFLYEVYKQLGIDDEIIPNLKLQGSHVVGWLYDPKDPTRDSYISFGIKDRETGEYSERALQMRKYGERNIVIDFNVDGDILTGKLDENGKPMKTFVTRIREIVGGDK